MNKEQQLKNLSACVQEHDKWRDSHAVWMQEVNQWRQMEQQIIGLVHEIGQAIPSHHRELEHHGRMIKDYTHRLQQHAQLCQDVRMKPKNRAQCQTELDHLQHFGQSDCLDCDEHCIAALMTVHRELVDAQQKMAKEQAKLAEESENAMQAITDMAARLMTCLGK